MQSNNNEPLIRIVKRNGLKKRYAALLYLISVIVALGIGAILLLSLKANPVEYYKQMFTLGTIDNKFAYLQDKSILSMYPS